MTKDALRQHYLASRQQADTSRLSQACAHVFSQWNNTLFQNKKCIASYKSIVKFKEFDIASIEAIILSQFPHIQFVYPTVQKDIIQFYSDKNDTARWVTNKWGISEIHDGISIHPNQIDIVLCPLIVCDLKGYRLGYGKGYYDKYLSQTSESCVKIGFGIFEPIEHIYADTSTDIPLDYYISPTQVYSFTSRQQ